MTVTKIKNDSAARERKSGKKVWLGLLGLPEFLWTGKVSFQALLALVLLIQLVAFDGEWRSISETWPNLSSAT